MPGTNRTHGTYATHLNDHANSPHAKKPRPEDTALQTEPIVAYSWSQCQASSGRFLSRPWEAPAGDSTGASLLRLLRPPDVTRVRRVGDGSFVPVKRHRSSAVDPRCGVVEPGLSDLDSAVRLEELTSRRLDVAADRSNAADHQVAQVGLVTVGHPLATTAARSTVGARVQIAIVEDREEQVGSCLVGQPFNDLDRRRRQRGTTKPAGAARSFGPVLAALRTLLANSSATSLGRK